MKWPFDDKPLADVRIYVYNTGSQVVEFCDQRPKGRSLHKCSGRVLASGSIEAMKAAHRLLSMSIVKTDSTSDKSDGGGTFKVGDVIKCIDASNWSNILSYDAIYRVDTVSKDGQTIRISCIDKKNPSRGSILIHDMAATRFAKYNAKVDKVPTSNHPFKKGDVVVCIDNEGIDHVLVKGKSYTVEACTETGRFVSLETSQTGKSNFVMESKRFVLASEIEERNRHKEECDQKVIDDVKRHFSRKLD
jgi:hypothetical protein